MKTLPPDHDLEKAIPFLLARAGARMGNAFSKALKPYGLSLVEWRVCASLQHTPNQTLSELALHSSNDLSALSRIVDRLSGNGLVVRERCGTDGRAIRLALTPLGLELTNEIIPLAKHYEAVALSDFSAAEVNTLRAMLLRIYANAEPLA
ncbi:MarR family winged helix-turn-helix transcriptional regulator [Variovorax sp. JS1663]|uniref:MarR family winged helix-turn-helix transcriptional regulator n=1 Tax=Variovorax sp. JS1663 TaxID=1851577 RepID=UPI000B349DC5|nr:MarR family transcriptional regulator [Variovorax sp. JS1663]OUM00163.1 MarR family transcriptional regulator [Variovorax sp. JS1663]